MGGLYPGGINTALQATLTSDVALLNPNFSQTEQDFEQNTRLRDLTQPLFAPRLLSFTTNDLIIKTVGKSNNTPSEVRAAQLALGSRFNYYENEWQAREQAVRRRAEELARERQERARTDSRGAGETPRRAEAV
jgi:hypothetical protein